MDAMNSLKALHDKMLDEKPDDAEHVAAECPFCTPQNTPEIGGRMSDKTFTEDEVQALVQAKVAEATAAIQGELDSIKETESAQAVEAKIAEVRAESEEKVNELQAQLDAAVIDATTSKQAYEDLTNFLQSEVDAATAAAELEERKTARLEQVAAVFEFSEEYVTANVDRWASMSDEDFEATLADYKAVAEKATASTADVSKKVPARTALTATRDETTTSKGSAKAAREVIGFRALGIDPREITR